MIDKTGSWSQEQIIQTFTGREFPSEFMLRALLSSRYFQLATRVEAGMSILDIGCLHARNLVPFADRGLNLNGIEVNEEMVELARVAAGHWGVKADVRQGTNRSIPFEDNTFDLVLSVDTIHYDEGQEAIHEALDEFVRVGRPGCHYLIATAGSEHVFHRSAVRLGDNRYRLQTDEF
jgi:SAM-dependent methyltransferase